MRFAAAFTSIAWAGQAAAAQPAAPAPFNLDCSGTIQTTVGNIKEQPVPQKYELRVDLAAHRWCGGECRETHSLESVEPRELIMVNQRDGPNSTYMTVNRESGAYYYSRVAANSSTVAKMQCERQPFTGFPERKF